MDLRGEGTRDKPPKKVWVGGLGHLPSWRFLDTVSRAVVFIENYQGTLQPQLYVLTLISHSDCLSLHKKTLSFSALPSPFASLFRAANAFRVTWSELAFDTSPRWIEWEGLVNRRTGTWQSSAHYFEKVCLCSRLSLCFFFVFCFFFFILTVAAWASG